MADIDAPLSWRMQQDGYLMQINQLRDENSKLKEWCTELLSMAESSDPEWLHWPELHDELQKLGVNMSNFKKLSAYVDVPCEWVSSSAPRNESEEGIVRCRDCENAKEHYEGMDVWWCEYLRMYVGSSEFCCWGNRRDGAQ